MYLPRCLFKPTLNTYVGRLKRRKRWTTTVGEPSIVLPQKCCLTRLKFTSSYFTFFETLLVLQGGQLSSTIIQAVQCHQGRKYWFLKKVKRHIRLRLCLHFRHIFYYSTCIKCLATSWHHNKYWYSKIFLRKTKKYECCRDIVQALIESEIISK